MIYVYLFYKVSSGLPERLCLSKDFKHVDHISYDGSVWVSYRFNRMGMQTDSKTDLDIHRYLRLIKRNTNVSAYVVISQSSAYRRRWFPFLIRSCNEFSRLLTGLSFGFTLTPRHLYKKLLKYDGKGNYRIIASWRRQDGWRRQQQARFGVRASNDARIQPECRRD